MQYYKDDTVDRTLATVLQIALSIPLVRPPPPRRRG